MGARDKSADDAQGAEKDARRSDVVLPYMGIGNLPGEASGAGDQKGNLMCGYF